MSRRNLAYAISFLLIVQGAGAEGWSKAIEAGTGKTAAGVSATWIPRVTPQASLIRAPSLVVNEIDPNQTGYFDLDEFVELLNVGTSPVHLADYNLRHIAYNWWTLFIDRTLDLPAVELAPGELYVLCKDASRVPNCRSETLFSLNDDNGVVAIVFDPEDRPSEEVLVDTFSYGRLFDGPTPPGPRGLPWVEGAPEDELDGSNVVTAPIGFGFARACGGVDTENNRDDFRLASVTPGSENFNDLREPCRTCACEGQGDQFRCCSAQGECRRDDGTPRCDCDPGWGGEHCDVPDLGCTPGSRSDCRSRGTCTEIAPGATACDCDSGFVGENCQRSVRDLSIMKNATWEDFDILRLPSVEELGEFSQCGVHEVRLEDTPQGCSWEGSVSVLGSEFELAVFSASRAEWSMDLSDATGRPVELGPPDHRLDDGEPGLLDAWQIDDAQAGEWSLRIHARGEPCNAVPTREGGYALCQESSPLALFAFPTQIAGRVGESVGFATFVIEDAQNAMEDFHSSEPPEIPTPAVGRIEEVDARVLQPDGTVRGVPVVSFSGSSVFTGFLLSATQTGEYLFALTVSGRDASGLPFRFQKFLSTTVVENPMRFLRPPQAELSAVRGPPSRGDSTVELEVRLDFPQEIPFEERFEILAREHYFATEVWAVGANLGTGATRRDVPVAWVGGLAVPEGGVAADSPFFALVHLELRAQWIKNANRLIFASPGGPFLVEELELRNVRFHDAETMLPLDSLPGPIAVQYPLREDPSEPSEELLWVRQLGTDFVDWREDRTMVDGVPSEFLEQLEEFIEDNEVPALVGDLVLSHGYCGFSDAFRLEHFRSTAAGGLDDRPVHFVGSFTGLDTEDRQRQARIVDTGDFRDELADFLVPFLEDGSPKPHPRSEEDRPITRRYLPIGIVAHSQGGLAALLAYSTRESSLQSIRDFEDRFEIIQTVATPYRGSGLDSALGAGGGVATVVSLISGFGLLGLFVALVARQISKFLVNALLNKCLGVKTVLDPPHAKAVMSCIPRADREVAQQTRVRHGRKPKWCHFGTNFFLPGDDDGVVQFERARVEGVRLRDGIDDPYCHNSKVDRRNYPDVRRALPVTRQLCNSSFMGALESACP